MKQSPHLVLKKPISFSIPSWVQKCLSFVPMSVAALLMLSGDVNKGILGDRIHHADIQIPPQETSISTELKYYYIQQREWIIGAIEERYRDSNLSCPIDVLRQYEIDIVRYLEDLPKEKYTNTLVYIFTEEELESVPQIRDAFIWLMSARYGGDYTDIHNWIEIFKGWVIASDLKVMIKFIKRDDGSYNINNISVVPQKKQEVMNSSDDIGDSGWRYDIA